MIRNQPVVLDGLQALLRAFPMCPSFTPIFSNQRPRASQSARLYTYWQCVQAGLFYCWQLEQPPSGIGESRRVFLYRTEIPPLFSHNPRHNMRRYLNRLEIYNARLCTAKYRLRSRIPCERPLSPTTPFDRQRFYLSVIPIHTGHVPR